MGEKIVFGKLYKSPLRSDKHPSASFWYSAAGTLYFNDFGIAKMYSIIDFVKQRFSLNFEQALNRIIQDLPLMKDGEVEKKDKEEVVFSFVPSNIEDGMSYFNKYKIPKQVVAKYTMLAKTIYRNEEYYGRSTPNNPAFIYKFPSGNIKIYRPLSPDKSKKWGGNANTKDIGGMYQLPRKGKLLLITSSIKDIMVLRQHGFNAICFNGEGYGTSDKSYSELRPYIIGLNKRFENIILFLDADDAGVSYSMKLASKLRCKYILLPKEKDISDYQKKYGVRSAFRMVKKLISKKFKQDGVPF